MTLLLINFTTSTLLLRYDYYAVIFFYFRNYLAWVADALNLLYRNGLDVRVGGPAATQAKIITHC